LGFINGQGSRFSTTNKIGGTILYVDLSSWINEIIGKYSATSVMVLEPWFKANLVIYLSFILIICLIGYATSKIRDYPFASGKDDWQIYLLF